MKVNVLRGTILPEKEIIDYFGEELVKGKLLLDGKEFPLLGSKRALLKPTGKCNIECILAQDQLAKGHRNTYLYVIRADICEDQTVKDKNKFKLEGVVDKIYPTTFTGSSATPLTRVKLRCPLRDRKRAFIDIHTAGDKSDKCASINVGYYVTSQCYLDIYRGEMSFHALTLRYTVPKKTK